jgi:hypothetical protein
LQKRDGKLTKVPYKAGTQRTSASSTNAATWVSLSEALDTLRVRFREDRRRGGREGIGYVFTRDDPYCGIDVDDCRDPATGELDEVGARIVRSLASYSEVSPSGTGVHVIVRGRLPEGSGNRRGDVEVYDHARFFTMTGAHLGGTPATIEERQGELEQLLGELDLLPSPNGTRPTLTPQPVDVADQELLELARRARNGAAFEALFAGDWQGRYPSQSEADLALCALLAFWTGRDPERIDRMFRASGLYREKWERDDYRQRTIDEAIAGCSDVYSPGISRNVGGTPERCAGELSAPNAPALAGGSAEGAALLRSPYRNAAPDAAAAPRDEAALNPDSAPSAAQPFALPIREFVARPREHREPILADVDGRAVIGHRSLTLCGGLGGVGKTTLFVDLALHLAAGVDYPPFKVPAPVSVLMIENEGPEDLFAEKLEARLATFEHELKARLDVCVFDWGGFNLAEDVHRERLANEIISNGYELVFGDPLDSLGIDGVGSPKDTRDFLLLMKLTGLNRTCAWWLNTHPRKEETKEALNEIAGAWGGKPDSVLLLRMLADDRTQVRFPKLRWAKRGKRAAILFGFDPETEAFSYLGEESEDERDYLAEIKELFADGKWRTKKEIASKNEGGIGAGEDGVKNALEQHPDVFESRTGAEAKAVGRSPTATVWQLRGGDPADWSDADSEPPGPPAHCELCQAEVPAGERCCADGEQCLARARRRLGVRPR